MLPRIDKSPNTGNIIITFWHEKNGAYLEAEINGNKVEWMERKGDSAKFRHWEQELTSESE